MVKIDKILELFCELGFSDEPFNRKEEGHGKNWRDYKISKGDYLVYVTEKKGQATRIIVNGYRIDL